MGKYDEELNKKILENIDEDYAKFHSALVPNTKIAGVKVPLLREIAKHFSKCDDFLDNITLDSFEKISVACYYIGQNTKDLKTLKNRLDFILPHINNWAVCDTFVSSLKILKKENFIDEILNYLNSKNDFIVRFSIVCLLDYYISEDILDDIFKKLLTLQNRSYYIDMAIAWFVSIAFIKQREKTLKLLKSKRLNKIVQNKSISKICDSFRIDEKDKQLCKNLRK